MTLLKRAEKKGSKYQNPVPTQLGGLSLMLKVAPEFLRKRPGREPSGPLGPFRTDAEVLRTAPVSGLRVTWFGHSSVLVEIDGVRVLIDPVWEERAAPTQMFGPKRFFPPTIGLEQLGPLDAVLVSHDHYDHLGKHSIYRLSRLNNAARARWVTSAGVGKRLRGFGVEEGRIAELDWTQSVEIAGAEMGQAIKITAWPARHFSGRGLFDRMTTLWSSFVLEGPKHRVFFGADSGYWPGFAEIAGRYDRFDLTMLEIGASNPLWANIHLGPDNAARAYTEMAAAMGGTDRAGLYMPIHWGLFNLALHPWRQPVERTLELAGAADLPLWLPTPGEPTEPVAGENVGERVVSGWWAGVE
jgi:L-ascorbate metabolism protein UlaG (beta-lactamase superfamily)